MQMILIMYGNDGTNATGKDSGPSCSKLKMSLVNDSLTF